MNLHRCSFFLEANMWRKHRHSELVTTNLRSLVYCNPLRLGPLQLGKREKTNNKNKKCEHFYKQNGFEEN